MPYRATKFANDEFFHVFNRGTDKRKIFLDNQDYARFLFMILHGQSKHTFHNIGRQVSHFVKHRVFNISDKEIVEKVVSERIVQLVAFALMPNHFHLLVRQEKEHGVSDYLQKVQNSYAKYFNEKYNRVGHLFSSAFKAVHISDDTQLLHLSAYIHKNPRELNNVKSLEEYPWSSLKDFIGKNRWKNLLDPEIVLEQFETKNDYRYFVKTSPAKELAGEAELNLD